MHKDWGSRWIGRAAAVERRDALSYAAFERDHLQPRRPVVLVGAVESWRALRTWTPAFFAERYRGRKVVCRNDDAERTMESYVAALDASTPDKPLPYLRNLNIQTDYPELVEDISPPLSFAEPDWLSSRLMPRDWLRPNRLNQLFISGRGARIPLHYDDWMTHNMVSNVYGDKRFLLFDPSQADHLYRCGDAASGESYILSAVDPWRPDLQKFPRLAEAQAHEVVIGKGDTLFVPAGWWHSSFTETTCISVSSSFANGSNWNLLVAEIGRLRAKEPAAKRLAVTAFLGVVGTTLGALRRVGVNP
jgi:hypothetical protein